MLPRIVFIFLCLCSCSTCKGQWKKNKNYVAEGYASYYAEDFDGKKTASGEIFHLADFTAAHNNLAFGTYVRVANKKNNYSIVVRINDRGPFYNNRLIDLSESAARRIGCYKHGITPVKIEELKLIQLTPAIDSMLQAYGVINCLGKKDKISGFSLSLWSTNDFKHALYIANDLYLKEKVKKVYIVTKKTGSLKKYHVVLSQIENRKLANKLKDYYEHQGFIQVNYIN